MQNYVTNASACYCKITGRSERDHKLNKRSAGRRNDNIKISGLISFTLRTTDFKCEFQFFPEIISFKT